MVKGENEVNWRFPLYWKTQRLRELREAAGLTLEELSERSGVEVAELYNAENGDGLMRVDIQRVADVLGTTPSDICPVEMPWFYEVGPEFQGDYLQRRDRWLEGIRERTAPGRGPERKKVGEHDPYHVTKPVVEAPLVFLNEEVPRILLANGKDYTFDGHWFRGRRGPVQAGGTVPIFGFTKVRLEARPLLTEQQVADKAGLKWVRLRDLLLVRSWPTLTEWSNIWRVLGYPDPDDLMWGEVPRIVSWKHWGEVAAVVVPVEMAQREEARRAAEEASNTAARLEPAESVAVDG